MKIAICIPHNHPQYEVRFSNSLFKMLATFYTEGLEVITDGYGFIDTMRNRLVQKAIDGNFDAILWLDSDMEFEPFTLRQLEETMEKYDLDGVTALTTRKEAPFLPHVYTSFDGKNFGMAGAFPLDQPFPVAGAGNGCLLIKTKVYKKYTESFNESWFNLPMKDGLIEFGEDLRFFSKMKDLSLMCDPRVTPRHLKIEGYNISHYIKHNGLKIIGKGEGIDASEEQLEKIAIEYMKLNGNYDEDSYMRTRQSPKFK